MDNLKISTVQFEHRNGDKEYNLSIIEEFSRIESKAGSNAICFHECSISGYSFARNLTKEQLLKVAEPIPGGSSISRLLEISTRFHIAILAGLFEKDEENRLFNTFLCVNQGGVISRHRKLHPFIHPDLLPGNEFNLFDLMGWKCGILTCYDNNIVENVRAITLLGAQILFMPHVTMLTPSSRPGSGYVNPALWSNRFLDPTSLRLEFDGIKGRSWLMKWLPSRAYDNGIYVVFSNAIGMDHDQLKNGCSMILDPFGDILSECRKLGNDSVQALLNQKKLTQSGGFRYKNARRPELYKSIIGQAHKAFQKVSWIE